MAFEDRKNRGMYPLNVGTPTIFTLPPGGKILQGRVIITGNLVISGGTTNGTTYSEGGPIGLIKRIIITANRLAGSAYPGGRIVDCTPRSLLRYGITQHGGKFIGELSGSTIGGGAAGTYPIYLSIPVYFADPTLRNSMSTALNADLGTYASIQVEVDLASDLNGCFLGNDRKIDATSSLTVQWQDERLALSGDTVPLFQEDHVMLIGSTFSRALDPAMPTDGIFQSMHIMAEQGTYRTLADTLLNRVTMKGQTIDFDEYALDIRQKMYDDEWYDPSQSGVGQYFIDFTEGLLKNGNPAPGLAFMFDVNNVSGANLDQLRIYTRHTYGLQATS